MLSNYEDKTWITEETKVKEINVPSWEDFRDAAKE